MINKPKVSIIVPIYNVEKYLERCMKSLQNQTLKDIEIILVDDESPDNCPKMCDKYKEKDTRIKVIHKKNGGLGFARNSGLEVATGEYVAFVDSDDFVTLDMCQKLYDSACNHNADIIYGGIYIDYADGSKKEIKYVDQTKVFQEKKDIENFMIDMIGMKPEYSRDTIVDVSVWKALFKTDILRKHNLAFKSEREYISEDVVFNMDIFPCVNTIVIIPDPVYFYCYNPSSLSRVYKQNRFLKDKYLWSYLNQKLATQVTKKRYEQALDRFLLARARCAMCMIARSTKGLGLKKCLTYIKEIENDKDVQISVQRYPIQKADFFPKVYFRLLRSRRTFLLYVICMLRNAKR